MDDVIKFDDARYLKCYIREHDTHQIACVVIYYPDTLEGKNSKTHDFFTRQLEVNSLVARHVSVYGHGMDSDAAIHINLDRPVICELTGKIKVIDDVQHADYIRCKKSD